MSRDIQLTHACPHLIIEEAISLGADRMSLVNKNPIASSGSIRLLANDQFHIPSYGLSVPALLTGSFAGPFRIKKAENTLTIKTQGESLDVILPVGNRITTAQVISKIKSADPKTFSASEKNGHLQVKEESLVGRSSSLQLSGVVRDSLGFKLQFGSRGKEVFPPWELITTASNRHLRFTKPIRTTPIIKMTYQTYPQTCLRCRGTLVENDIRFDESGDALYVEDENLLYQNSLKIILTDLGSNLYHTWYGSNIRRRIGSKATSTVAAMISEDVRNALQNLQATQLEQSNYQTVTFKERLYQVQSVETFQSEEDPTMYIVDVVVRNASNEPVKITTIFTVPSVIPIIQGKPLRF